MAHANSQTLPTAPTQVKHPYLVLMGLYLGGFTGMYSETALNIALPQISGALSVDLALTQWLVVGYMLVIGLVLPFSSLLTKWFSARKISLFALGAFLVGALISGLAPSFVFALAGRAIQGIGTGLILPLMFAMVMEVIPPHKIGAAMGMNALVIMTASAIGSTLAGFLVAAVSWRAIFFSFVVILIVGIGFILAFCVNPFTISRPKIDAISVISSCLGFGGIVFGAGVASLYGWLSVPTDAALVVGVIALVTYVRRQLDMDVPVIDLRVFSISGFRIGTLCVMCNFGITLAVMYILPQFYQNSMFLAVSFAGLIMLPGGIINAIVSVISGNIFDRIGARIPALLGFGLSIIGVIMLSFAQPTSPLAYVITCHIILMIGVPLAMSPCQTFALASLPHKLSTDGSTMINTMQQVFGAIATALATYLLATGQNMYTAAGGANAALGFTQGSHMGFAFALVLAVIAFVLATRIKSRAAVAATAGTAAQAPQAAMQGHAESATKAATHVQGAPTQPSSAAMGADIPGPNNASTASTTSSNIAASAGHAGTLASLMKTPVYTLTENDSALSALELFTEKGISGAPIVDGSGSLTGFVSDGDIIGALSHQYPQFTSFYAAVSDTDESFDEKLTALETMTVGALATRSVITVPITADMRTVATTLSSHHLKKAPVMDGSTMVGIINRSNITRYAVDAYAARTKDRS